MSILNFELAITGKEGSFKIMKRRDIKTNWVAFGTRVYKQRKDADAALDKILKLYPTVYTKFIEPKKNKR
jgi:hypothetical protein